jgi:hypothetical protein
VLESREHTATLAREGRKFVLETFSPESAAAKYANIYRTAVEERAA